MARLPVPGQDNGTWGVLLNSFLGVSLADDGTLNSAVVGNAQLKPNAVTSVELAPGSVTTTALDASTQTTLSSVASKYVKPVGGIPATDLSSSVQASLSSGGAQALSVTAVKTSAYAAVAGDLIPADATTTEFTITLPTAPADKSRITVKKIDGTNNLVTIATAGSDVLNKAGGNTSVKLSLQNQALSLQYANATAIWYVVSDDIPVTSVVTGTTKTVTTTYAILTTDHVILADATSAAFTVTLPTAVGYSGRFTIDAITTTANLVTIATTSSQVIDGASTVTVGTQTSSALWTAVDVVSDGSNWRIV